MDRRDTDLFCDLRLAQPREVAQVQQPALALVEDAEAGRQERTLLALLVAALENVELAVALVVLRLRVRQRERRLDRKSVV